jgi:hypothetical protein
MSLSQTLARVLPAAFLSVALLVMAMPASAQPQIKIVVDGSPPTSCTAPGDCSVYVKEQRGAGVCKAGAKLSKGNNPFCSDKVTFKLQELGNVLLPTNVVLIQWSPQASSPGSFTCFKKTSLVLSKGADTADLELDTGGTNFAKCMSKSAWFYDVILINTATGAEIDRDDPGVIIDN